MASPPAASARRRNARLRYLPSKAGGAVFLQLKKPWQDRTTHVELTPSAFIARLASLAPRPKRMFSEPIPVDRARDPPELWTEAYDFDGAAPPRRTDTLLAVLRPAPALRARPERADP